MEEYSKQHKKAWEYDAYDFWVKHSGTPAERAKKDKENPKKMLKQYVNYFDTFEEIKVANICGSCGKKAIPLALLGAEVAIFDISEDNKRYALEAAEAAGVKISFEVGDVLEMDCTKYGEYFDVVFMEGGVLHYFHDINEFMKIMYSILKPGGKIICSDFHPFTKIMDALNLEQPTMSYFSKDVFEGEMAHARFYDDEIRSQIPKCSYRKYTISEILNALIENGFCIKRFDEYPSWENDRLPGEFTAVGIKEGTAMSELWDCYDKAFQKVEGKILVRGQEATFSADEYHLVCDVAVRHADGTYLLMQRDYRKEGYPGKWEFTAGGSALQGERPEECAKRELLEETGLVADSMREVGRITIDENHSHYVVYMAAVSCEKDAVVLQDGETIDYRWVEKSELLKMKEELATWRVFDMLPNLEEKRYEIIHLPKEQWKGIPIMMITRSDSFYDVEISPMDENGCTINLVCKRAEKEIVHTPEEYDFPDSLYQDHWEDADAYGIVSEKGELLACIEVCPEVWSNRLMVTELWVSDALRKQGYGKMLMDKAKEIAKEQKRRAIILETQSCNTNAIGFYLHQGFELIGFDKCCYTNKDIERREVRFNMGYFFDVNGRWG